MICRCQGASFVSSYPRVLSFSDCSFSFSSSSRFSFSCSFLLGSGRHRTLWSPEPPVPLCPLTRPGKGLAALTVSAPCKGKAKSWVSRAREQPAGSATLPGPGSPLLLQLLAQDVPPPGWHAGQARLLLLLLQQTPALPAPLGARRCCRHHGAAASPQRMALHLSTAPAGDCQHHCPIAPRCPPSGSRGRRKECAAWPALRSTPQLYCNDTREPTLPRHRKRHTGGEHSPGATPPAQHTATASGTLQPRPAAT